MEQQITHALVWVVEILLGVIMAFIAYLSKTLHTKVEKINEDLSEFKTQVAERHPTHENIDRRFDKIDAALEKVSQKVDHNFDKLLERISVANDHKNN